MKLTVYNVVFGKYIRTGFIPFFICCGSIQSILNLFLCSYMVKGLASKCFIKYIYFFG